MTKKEKITQTALQLIVNQGIQETPMSQISKVSGVAMGTIYHHFKSKNEIINQIYLDVKKEFGASIMKDVDKKMEYKARFYQIWKNIFNFFYQHELMFRFSQHFGHLPIITETTRQEGLVFYEPVIDFLAEGIQLKILKNIDLQLMTETIYGNVVALTQLAHSKTLKITNTLLEQAIAISWDGVHNSKNLEQ